MAVHGLCSTGAGSNAGVQGKSDIRQRTAELGQLRSPAPPGETRQVRCSSRTPPRWERAQTSRPAARTTRRAVSVAMPWTSSTPVAARIQAPSWTTASRRAGRSGSPAPARAAWSAKNSKMARGCPRGQTTGPTRAGTRNRHPPSSFAQVPDSRPAGCGGGAPAAWSGGWVRRGSRARGRGPRTPSTPGGPGRLSRCGMRGPDGARAGGVGARMGLAAGRVVPAVSARRRIPTVPWLGVRPSGRRAGSCSSARAVANLRPGR